MPNQRKEPARHRMHDPLARFHAARSRASASRSWRAGAFRPVIGSDPVRRTKACTLNMSQGPALFTPA